MIGRLVIDDFFDPVPLHRTATFYLGLFPIVILLWAWADSMRKPTTWYKIPEDSVHLQIALDRAAFRVEKIRSMEGMIPGFMLTLHRDAPLGRISRPTMASTRDAPWFVPYESSSEIQNTQMWSDAWGDYEIKRHVIPFWLLLATYLPLWLAASFFHARRKQKRLQQSLPSAQPQPD